MLSLNLLLSLLVPGSLFLLGLIVYLNNPRSATNKSFLLMVLASSGSAVGVFLSRSSTSPEVIFFWIKLTMFFASFASPTILLFIYTFPLEKFKINKIIGLVEIALALIFSISAFGPWLYKNVLYENGSVLATPGPILPFFGVSFGAVLIAIALRLYNKFKQAYGKEREQFRYLAYGILLMLIPVGIFDLFFPLFLRNTDFVGLGVSAFIIFEAAVFYSITKHRLLDIRLVVARTVAYTLLLAFIGVFYAAGSVVTSSIFLKTPTPTDQIILYTVLTIIVAFTFQPLRSVLEKYTDKIFFKGHYDSQELLTNLTKIMALTLGLDQLTEGILVRLLPEMRISKGAFVLLEKGKVNEVKYAGFDKKIKFVGTDILALLESEKILVVDELEDTKIKHILQGLDVTVSVPFRAGTKEIGVLLLGYKLSGEIYTDQDIKVLEVLAPEISIAIQNAKAYEEIKRFNITLQEEVAKATSDLRHANERLKELDKLKDEFMSIASHELRTPMTAIKSYVWLALHGKVSEKDPHVRSYLDKVFESSERMINMINDMLNVSRIETGRIKLEIVPVSVWKVAEQVKDDLSARAAETGVTVEIKKEGFAPTILADKDKLAEIFTNLVGNSLKFTKKGGKVTVSANKKGDVVEVSVTDTGVGIAAENISKLFKKYGKLNESYALTAPSTGTGLGLYITKQYLEKMGGVISVQSVFGQGTTFTFTLPVATGKELAQSEEPEESLPGVVLNPKMFKRAEMKKAGALLTSKS